jgi:hypothetical protein
VPADFAVDEGISFGGSDHSTSNRQHNFVEMIWMRFGEQIRLETFG